MVADGELYDMLVSCWTVSGNARCRRYQPLRYRSSPDNASEELGASGNRDRKHRMTAADCSTFELGRGVGVPHR